MRLVTFEDPAQRRRIGAVTDDARFVDLHSACALYLRDVENESAFQRLADALVPPNMLALFEGGDTSLEAAHKAFDHALRNDGARGPAARPSSTPPARSSSKPQSFRESSFTPPATSANITKRPPRPDSRIL